MSAKVELKVEDKHFQDSFREYLKVTHRSHVDAVNNKLFMIARKSLWFTKRADQKSISKALGRVTFLRQKNYDRIYRHTLRKGTKHAGVPLAALIINKRAKKGQGLYGKAMREAITRMVLARRASVAYIASCWLPAIQTLAKYATIKATADAREDKAAKQIGRKKGRAVHAVPGKNVITGLIENEGFARHDKNNAFQRYGAQGMQAGIDSEWKDNVDQIKKAMQPAIDTFNASQR
jgi:hypothetical protein